MYRFQFLNETYEFHTPHLGALAAIGLGLTFGLAMKPWASDFDSSGPQLVMGPRMPADEGDSGPQYATYGSGPTPWWVTGTFWRRERESQPIFAEDVWRERGWDQPSYDYEQHYADARYEPAVSTYRAPLYGEPEAYPYSAAEKREVFVADDQSWREVDDPAHGADPGAKFGKPAAQDPGFDRGREFDDSYGPEHADVYDAAEAPAGRESFAQGGLDPRNSGAPMTIREHVERSLGGGAG